MYRSRQPGTQHGVEGDGATHGGPGKSTLTGGLPSVQRRAAPAAAPAAPATPVVQMAPLTDAQRDRAQDQVIDDLPMEQIAHRLAYLDGSPGSVRTLLGAPGRRTPTGAAIERMGFDCDDVIYFSGASDLQYWGLRARPGEQVTPVMAFRGTQTDADRADDTNRMGVGMGQFLRNQGRIRFDLERLGAGRGVATTGHSLGGTLAQIAACFFPELVVHCTTFQAPGVSRDVIARLRDNPGAVTARHHRVHGDPADDAGHGFVPGPVTEYGTGGRGEPGNPLDDHNSFPLLSAAGAAREPWMSGAAYPGLARTRAGSTDDPSFGRPLRGGGDLARGRPGETGAIVGGVIGGILGGPGGAILGGAAGGHLAGGLRGDVEQDEIYGRIWIAAYDRALAADTTPWRLEREYIDRPCREQDIPHLIGDMRGNYNSLFPEYAVLASLIIQDRSRLASVDALLSAVRGVRDLSLDDAAIQRVRRLFPIVRADPPA